MGIDIAVRSFKLVVLKALAPIPILSYISPKSAKDGIFSSYVKLFATTWLDLFIKFGVIYLGFAFIQLILNGDLSVGLTSALLGSGFGMVFLILGAIIFMFQAPKFIKKALNLKDGEFGTGIAGLLGMGAATAGMIGSGVSGYKASIAADDANHRKHNVFRNVGAGLVGAIGGGATGAKVAMGKDASIGKVMEALNKKNAQTLAMGAAGSTGVGRFATNAQTFFTGQSEYDKDQKNIAALEAKEATANFINTFNIQNIEELLEVIKMFYPYASNDNRQKSGTLFKDVPYGSPTIGRYFDFCRMPDEVWKTIVQDILNNK